MKKLLALVLALVMTMSLVTISNAAFKDADKIDHTEAVEVMNALGVINGMPDGSFNPSGSVTRAEMAKMITIVMLGDIDAAAFKGTATDLTDINGHWAEGYIKYCYSQGVIAGRGDGTFAPNANVTAVEAAKMLLVAIGYNADVQGYVGNDWAINIIRDAQLSKFFDDLSVTSTKVLTRDEAAQMIWNAVQAKMIEKTPSISITDGKITYSYNQHRTNTLLNTTFKAEKKYAYLTGTSYSSDDKNYTYSFTTAAAFGGGQITTDALVNNTTASLDGTVDYSALYGQKVAVVYNTTSGAKNPVYGIYSEAKVVAEGVVNDLATATDANKVKVAGTTYTLTAANRNAVPVFAFNNGTTVYTRANLDAVISGNAASNWYDASAKVVLLDNTGDNKADVVIIYPVTIGKVTYASKTSVVVDGGVGTFAYNKDKANWSNTNSYTLPELVKDDYVAVAGTTVTNVDYAVTKLDTVSGKVTALDAGNRKVQLDSTWYNYAGTVSFTLSDTVKVQLNNGLIVASKVVDTASKDLLVVEASASGNSLTKVQAKVMFADGTEETISVKKLDGSTIGAPYSAITAMKLYTYTKNSDGTYNISAVNAGNKAGYTTYAESTTTSNLFTEKSSSSAAKFSGQMIADDAVFFVYDSTNDKWSVISGATLKGYATKNGAALYSTITSQMLLGTSNGVYGVKAATMNVSAAFGTSNTYGYVLSAPYTSKDANDVTVYNYKLWTADGEKTVVDTNNPGAKGTLVKYTVNTDNTITSAAHGLTAVAITAYDDETITLNKADGTVLGKVNTTISTKADKLFINTADVAGSEGGALAVAQRLADGSYIMNAYAAVDGNGVVTAIVFDINNDLDDTNAHKDDADGTKTGTAGMTATGLSATTNASYVKEYTYVVEGEYVKITATLTAAANGTTLTAAASGTNVEPNSGSITLPASGTAVGDTFVMYVLVANDGNGAISGLSFSVTET